jgi:RsiW-degrading membrane proteinase PrsW (M82 family)
MIYHPATLICLICSRPLQPGARFCGGCGAPAPAGSSSSAIGNFVDSVVSVSLKEIVLMDKITGSQILKSPVFRFICLFALTPLLILTFDSYSSILNGLAIWSGFFWAILLYRLFADRDLRFHTALTVFLVTSFVMMPVFDIYLALPPRIVEAFVEWDPQGPLRLIHLPVNYFGFVFGVGIREEMCKAAPLLVLCLFSAKLKNPLNGLVLGMMSGVGFAASENVYYVFKTVNNAIAVTQRTGDFSNLVFPVYNNVVRMMTGPFAHAVYSGVFGYFISLAAADKARRIPLFFAGLFVAAFLHGSYDMFVGYSVLWGVAILTGSFFLLMTYLLKARGLTSAADLASGMFQRTVIRRVPEGFAAPVVAAPASIKATQPDSEKEPTAGAAGRPAEPIVETLELEDLLAEHVEIPTGTLAIGSGWRLRIVGGPNLGRLYRLKGNEMLIGRDSARCQVHLGESMVSRQHAVLLAEGKGWRVKRLSTNSPLYVNGEAIEDQLLKPGDQIQIGSTLFVAEGL